MVDKPDKPDQRNNLFTADEIIEVSQDDVNQIMEHIGHGMLGCVAPVLFSLSNPDSLWFGYIRNMMDGVNMHSGKCHV